MKVEYEMLDFVIAVAVATATTATATPQNYLLSLD